jgi:hypothetical protein
MTLKIEELNNFLDHLELTAEKCFDMGQKFDCTIEVNGKKITLPFSADLLDTLNRIMEEEKNWVKE